MYKRNALRILLVLSLLSLNLFIIGSGAALQSKAGITSSKVQEPPMTKKKDDVAKQSPFACNVGALNAEQRQQYAAIIKRLNSSKQEVKELADGYAFRFSSDSATLQDLGQFIVYERLCCPFFDFEMVVEREGGPAWLRLRGREGVKDFIRLEFGVQ